jgi:hypothetical protein
VQQLDDPLTTLGLQYQHFIHILTYTHTYTHTMGDKLGDSIPSASDGLLLRE